MIIFQKPNALLITATVGFVISKLAGGAVSIFANTVFIMAITVWAYVEVTQGVNLFRKLLGATVLVLIGVSLFNQLLQ